MSKLPDSEVFIEASLKTASPNPEHYKSIYQTIEDPLRNPGVKHTRIVRKIARWKDPSTPPHTRTSCVKWCQITPNDKWCCGWKTESQWIYNELYVEVRTATEQDIIAALEDCLRQAAIASAVAAIVAAFVTGGAAYAAAKATFVTVLRECLVVKLQNIISIALLEESNWGDWE